LRQRVNITSKVPQKNLKTASLTQNHIKIASKEPQKKTNLRQERVDNPSIKRPQNVQMPI
jgi:hypothetical protein